MPVVITAAGELEPGTALDDTNAPLLRGGGYPMWAEDQVGRGRVGQGESGSKENKAASRAVGPGAGSNKWDHRCQWTRRFGGGGQRVHACMCLVGERCCLCPDRVLHARPAFKVKGV